VMAGGPVMAGTHGTCEQVDLAPTVAALLGIAVPASNQGRPLLDFLALTPEHRQEILRTVLDQRARFVAHYVSRVDGPPAGRPVNLAAATGTPLDPDLHALDGQAEEAKEKRMASEGRSRLVVLVAVVAALAAVAAALWASAIVRPPVLALAVLGGIAAAVVYFSLFRVAGLQYSFSAVNRDEVLGRFFLTDMVLAVTSCVLATALAAGWLFRRTGRVPFIAQARLAFLVAAVFCALLVLKMTVAYWRHGIFVRWQMPDQFWAFGFYLDTLAVVALGFSAPLMPLFAWLGTALALSTQRTQRFAEAAEEH
jgi:MFS family permease